MNWTCKRSFGQKHPFLLTFLALSLFLQAGSLCKEDAVESIRRLYGKNNIHPISSYEALMISHVEGSLRRALLKESKLNDVNFDFCPIYAHHLLNNLCTLVSASYLQIGLIAGENFISALYGNIPLLVEKRGVSLSRGDIEKEIFRRRCSLYLGNGRYQIEFPEQEKSLLNDSFDICFYDVSQLSPKFLKQNFLYLNSASAPVFTLVIDDWNWDPVRKEAFDVFDEFNYKILFEDEIPSISGLGNGMYIAVVKK